MIRKYGIDMQLPEGKPPGYCARIVTGIDELAPLFDRHEELLVFDSPNDLPPVLALLAHYRVDFEECKLLLLPQASIVQGPLYSDYAIRTRSDHLFVDLSIVAAFRLAKQKPESEPDPAWLQLEEHLIASFEYEGFVWHLIERQLAELADRVAHAYGCIAEWRAL